jgi:hypothetical protein
VIALLGAFIERTHGRDISQWFVENWNCVDLYHFKLFEYLKAQKSAQSYDLLHLSLGVVVSDTALFTDYTTEFLKTPVSRLLYEYLKDRRHQQSSCSKSLPHFALPLCPKEMRLFLELVRRN